MNNVRDLKENVKIDENMEETKQIIENSEDELPVEELDQVNGGDGLFSSLRPKFLPGRGV